MGVTRVEQSDGAFTFTGAGWAIDESNAYASGSSFSYSSTPGDYVEVAYSGFGCALITECLSIGGEFDIYLDDVWQMRSTNLIAAWTGAGGSYAGDVIWQFPIYVPCATDTDHVLKLVVVSGQVFVDAVDVVDALDGPTSGKLLGIGDSWTEGAQATTTANQFINQVQVLLGAGSLVNAGVGGNELCGYKTPYTYWRFLADAVAATPQYLVIEIGFNDHRRGTSLAIYERFYDALLRMLKARLNTASMTVVCCTPGYSTAAGLTRYPPYDHATRAGFLQFGNVVRAKAKEFGFICAELYAAMNQTDALMHADDVHPNDLGHDVISYEIWRAINASGSFVSLFQQRHGVPMGSMA